MDSERFTIMVDEDNFVHILDNNIDIGQYNLCKLLNKLFNENEEVKEDYQDAINTLFEVEEKYIQLKEEKEDWKLNYVKEFNQNQILWNEINILMGQGAEPSEAFKNYLDDISTDYDKFWRRKLEQAKNDEVI